jgi:hypothetical protein
MTLAAPSCSGLPMAKDRFSESTESIYRNSRYVVSREFGIAPNGNRFNGMWVVRDIKTGEYVEHSAHRHDMLEKYV